MISLFFYNNLDACNHLARLTTKPVKNIGILARIQYDRSISCCKLFHH